MRRTGSAFETCPAQTVFPFVMLESTQWHSAPEHARRAGMAEATPQSRTPAPAPEKRKLSNLMIVWGYTSRYPGHLSLAILALLCAATATLYIPYTFKQVIDNGFAQGADLSAIGPYFWRLLMV